MWWTAEGKSSSTVSADEQQLLSTEPLLYKDLLKQLWVASCTLNPII